MNLVSRTPYTPGERPESPLKLGDFLILRPPLMRTPHTRYTIVLDGAVIGTQISYPSLADCEGYRRQSELAQRRRAVDVTIGLALEGSLTEQIIAAVSAERMSLTQLSKLLGHPSDNVSSILSRLVRQSRIQRHSRGARRSLYGPVEPSTAA